MKLSIGCGKENLDEGWQGIDIFDHDQKFVHDLEIIPWPIESETYEEVKAYHVLEHIHQDKVIAVMNEINRILKPKGIVDITVPSAHYPNEAFSDPTHLSTWTLDTFKNYFCGKSPRNADYGIIKWQSETHWNETELIPGDIHIKLRK